MIHHRITRSLVILDLSSRHDGHHRAAATTAANTNIMKFPMRCATRLVCALKIISNTSTKPSKTCPITRSHTNRPDIHQRESVTRYSSRRSEEEPRVHDEDICDIGEDIDLLREDEEKDREDAAEAVDSHEGERDAQNSTELVNLLNLWLVER